MEKDATGLVTKVNISSTLELDPCRLATLSHLVTCLSHVTRLLVLRVKVKVDNVRDVDIPELKAMRSVERHFTSASISLV